MTTFIDTHSRRTIAFVALVFAVSVGPLESQEVRRTYVDHATLVTSQFGFRPQSPKTVTLLPSPRDSAIPDATTDRFVRRLDDSPYMEMANAVERNTQKARGVPFYHAIGAVRCLSMIEGAQ